MTRRIRIFGLASLLVLVSCANSQATIPPIRYKSFRTNGKRIGTITADGRYRNAFVGKDKVCAEPPPDIAASYDLKQAVSASLQAAVAYEALSISASGEGESSQSGVSEIAEVAEKTEALLVVRESLYRLCELTLNTKIDTAKTVSIFREILYTTRDLGRHDVLEQLVEAIEAAVGFDGTTAEMLAELVGLAAHIATIETYQSALMTASTIPDDAARALLLGQLSAAFVRQLQVFPAESAALGSSDLVQCESGEHCVLRSAEATDLLRATLTSISGSDVMYADSGWKFNVLPPILGSVGLRAGDIVVGVHHDGTYADFKAVKTTQTLMQALNPIIESKPTAVKIAIIRAAASDTIDLEIRR